MTASETKRRLTTSERRRRATTAALRHLRRADPRLREIIARVGAFRPVITPDPFVALVGSIVHQQVSMSAAAAIQRRLCELFPGRRVRPAALLQLSQPALRGAGLSRQKALYLRGLAAAFADGTLSAAKLRRMSDDEVIAATTALKGIGRWTAEMLLMFRLGRSDVLPVDDYGIRKAMQQAYRKRALPKAAWMRRVAEPWRPYRTVACWYLWRSGDGTAGKA